MRTPPHPPVMCGLPCVGMMTDLPIISCPTVYNIDQNSSMFFSGGLIQDGGCYEERDVNGCLNEIVLLIV